MGLMSRYSQQGQGKQKMSREQLIGLIQADVKFMNERDDIAAYINTLRAREGLSEAALRKGYTRFKKEKGSTELGTMATRHQLAPATLQAFVDGILQDAGKVSAEIAQAHAISEFEKYRIVQDRLYVSDFDAAVQKLENDATGLGADEQ